MSTGCLLAWVWQNTVTMRPPRHVLHPGPASKPTTRTVGTSQEKDLATVKEMITLWEYLRRVAEKSSGQAREKEEQQSPFWGSRLAIPPLGTGRRRHTPCAAERSVRQAREAKEQRTPFWGTRLAIPLPGSQPCSSDHPVSPSGSRRKNMANADSLLQFKAVESIPSRSLSRPSTPAWVLSGLAAVQTAVVPVPDSTEGSADAPALVSAGVQLDASALVSAGGQPEAPAPVSAGGQPDTSVPALVPPFKSTKPAHLLGFLWGILSEISCVPASVPVLGSSAASLGPSAASLGSPAASLDSSSPHTAFQDSSGFCTASQDSSGSCTVSQSDFEFKSPEFHPAATSSVPQPAATSLVPQPAAKPPS
ncbi:hypothetical protein ATANTOWER_028678 [Ataeniobius toweri]|uniref:Uncharacterized protein n=1 Tax=Ataeniobius toweri TaxID=208326 RepID=A0ABU7C634_9TELE|nr:hypothetical protein [Ataeniobius toweri]